MNVRVLAFAKTIIGTQSKIPILDQLPPAQLPLGDALEPGSLEVVGFDAALGVGCSGSNRWNTRRGTQTTPRHSPISTPNSPACRSAVQRASSGKVKNRGLCSGLPLFSRCSAWDLRRAAPWAVCRALD
jgi:hypothetical protein